MTTLRSLLRFLPLAVLLIGCGGPNPDYMPPSSGTADMGASSPDLMKPAPRLYHDGGGSIRDPLMAHQKCTWMIAAGTCDLRCLPTLMLEQVCAKGGLKLWALPRGYSFPDIFGTVAIEHDPKCDFEKIYRLQQTTGYSGPNSPTQFFNCETGQDITKDVYQIRAVFPGVQTTVVPAPKSDGVSPTRP